MNSWNRKAQQSTPWGQQPPTQRQAYGQQRPQQQGMPQVGSAQARQSSQPYGAYTQQPSFRPGQAQSQQSPYANSTQYGQAVTPLPQPTFGPPPGPDRGFGPGSPTWNDPRNAAARARYQQQVADQQRYEREGPEAYYGLRPGDRWLGDQLFQPTLGPQAPNNSTFQPLPGPPPPNNSTFRPLPQDDRLQQSFARRRN